MSSIRTSVFALLLTVGALGACDTIFGPSNDPAAVEIVTRPDTIAFVGTTVPLEARVRNADGHIVDASVSWLSRSPEVADVDAAGRVTARSNGQAWILARSGSVADSVLVTVDSPIACAPVGELAVPDTVGGELVAGECELDGRYHEVWRLDVAERQTVTLDLVSGEFNTFLWLLNGDGQIIGTDDDGGQNFNARLLIELDAGTYYPLATTRWPGLTGSYQLTTIVGAHPTPCPATDTVMFPDTVSGTTTTGSCDYDGFYIDSWRLELDEPTMVTLQLEGDGFGMYLAVADTLGRFLTSGGDGPSEGAWMELELPAGAYDLWAGGREAGATGDYTLMVKQGPATLQCPTEGVIGVGESVTGQVADDDCYVWYAPSDGWELVVEDTTELQIAVTSDPFYPALLVSDSTGQLINAGYDRESYMRVDTTMAPGRYRLWLQSVPLETGDYHLSVVESGALGACDPVGGTAVDSTREGALSTTDCALIDGRYTDVWTLQVDSAVTATIDLVTDKFDPYLIVADTVGSTIARDDDSGEGANASLTLDFEAGVYHLWTTSYAAGSIGGYQLTVASAVAALVDLVASGVEADAGTSTLVWDRSPLSWEARPAPGDEAPAWVENAARAPGSDGETPDPSGPPGG